MEKWNLTNVLENQILGTGGFINEDLKYPRKREYIPRKEKENFKWNQVGLKQMHKNTILSEI